MMTLTIKEEIEQVNKARLNLEDLDLAQAIYDSWKNIDGKPSPIVSILQGIAIGKNRGKRAERAKIKKKQKVTELCSALHVQRFKAAQT